MTSSRFIAHLVNQQVAHELLALEILTLLLANPTDDSVEVAVAFLKEVGQKLTELSPRFAIFFGVVQIVGMVKQYNVFSISPSNSLLCFGLFFRGMQSIFETLRNVLHEANIDKRVQYMVEVMFAIRKDGFKQHPSVVEELDKCEEEDQFTHALQLDDDLKGEEGLNVFKAGKKLLVPGIDALW